MTRTAEQITAALEAARAQVAALEVELAAALRAEENTPTAEQRTAASRLANTAQTIAPSTTHGPTAHRAADKAVITRRFNEALKVWGGDYAALRRYTLDYIAAAEDDLTVGGRYLVRNQFAR